MKYNILQERENMEEEMTYKDKYGAEMIKRCRRGLCRAACFMHTILLISTRNEIDISSKIVLILIVCITAYYGWE